MGLWQVLSAQSATRLARVIIGHVGGDVHTETVARELVVYSNSKNSGEKQSCDQHNKSILERSKAATSITKALKMFAL